MGSSGSSCSFPQELIQWPRFPHQIRETSVQLEKEGREGNGKIIVRTERRGRGWVGHERMGGAPLALSFKPFKGRIRPRNSVPGRGGPPPDAQQSQALNMSFVAEKLKQFIGSREIKAVYWQGVTSGKQ